MSFRWTKLAQRCVSRRPLLESDNLGASKSKFIGKQDHAINTTNGTTLPGIRPLSIRSTLRAEHSDGQKSGGNVLIGRPSKHVVSVQLDRPTKKNAFSIQMADQVVSIFESLDADPTVRCVVLSGNGPDFTSGVDVTSFMAIYKQLQDMEDVAHRTKLLRSCIERFQAPFKTMYEFSKPIISVQHGLSLGLATELASCCDMRYCSRDAKMAIREVLIGIAADVGTLQLAPKLTSNQSLLSELIYTGRYMTPEEALSMGFVTRILDSKEEAIETALELASTISKRSPVAVQGIKRNLRFSRDKPFAVGLDYNAIWNAAMMQGEDLVKAIGGIMSKQDVDEIEYEDF